MANETLITDLVAQQALDQLAALDKAMEDTLETYANVGKELAKGLKVPVTVQGDLDKLEQVYTQQMQRAGQTTQQLTQIQQQQAKVIADTTNTISRQLAEQEKLNKLQREAYTEEQRGLEIAKNVLGTHEQNVHALARVNKEMKNLKAAYKEGSVTAEEYTRRELELKTAKAELQKILNNETKMMQAAEGSYQRLSLQLERMKMAQKQLNEEEKRGADGQALEKEIQALDAHLKDMAADMGEFQRNVGNYAIAGKSLRSELKELTMQMAQMLADGVDPTSEGFLEVAERAGRLKDAMEDAKDTIKDYANDTQGLSQGVSVIQTAVGAWQTLAGAMSAFGMENEDAAKATQKLMGIMSLMQGIQKVSTELTTNGTGAYRAYHAILKLLGLEKAAFTTATAAETTAMEAEAVAATEAATAESAVAVGTEAASVASGAHTAAVGVETAALTGATAAATALKLALAALGIGAVIALIVTLYEGIKEFNKEAEESAKIVEDLAKANDEAKTSYLKSKGEMEMYIHTIENFNGTKEQEKALVDELNSKYGDAIGHYQTLDQWKKALTTTGLAYIETLEWEAQAQADLNAMVAAQRAGNKEDEEFYRMQFESRMQTVMKERDRIRRQIERNTPKPVTSSSKSSSSRRTKSGSRSTSTDNGAEDAEKQMKELIKESQEMLDQGLEAVTRRVIETESVITEASEAAYNERIDTIQKQYNVLQNLIEEHKKAAVLAEQEKYDKAIAEANKYKKDTTDLENAKWAAAKEVSEKYNRDLEDLEAERNATLEDMATQRLALIEKGNEEEIAAVQAYNAKRLAALQEAYIEELRQAEGNEQKIQEVKDRYAKDAAEIAEQNAISIARASVMGLEEALEMEDLSAEDRERIAKELADAKMQLAKAVANAEENQLERTIDAEQKARDVRMSKIQDWAQKAGDAISAVADLMGAIYDGQIAKIEEQMDAEEAHHEQQMADIDELAERGAITQEEAELRKREAEEATAKKQEALEKKKAQAEYKRAVMEKANNISQIAIATALGIMKASPNWAMMALVGAMGAIQIATALAQPIKAYKEGTKGKPHPGGLAVVGDGGRTELVVLGRNIWLTPAEPTLVDLPKGAEVFPNVTDEDVRRLGASLPTAIPRDKSSGAPLVINDYSELSQQTAMNTKAIIKALGQHEQNLSKALKEQTFADYLRRRL